MLGLLRGLIAWVGEVELGRNIVLGPWADCHGLFEVEFNVGVGILIVGNEGVFGSAEAGTLDTIAEVLRKVVAVGEAHIPRGHGSGFEITVLDDGRGYGACRRFSYRDSGNFGCGDRCWRRGRCEDAGACAAKSRGRECRRGGKITLLVAGGHRCTKWSSAQIESVLILPWGTHVVVSWL